MYGLFDLARGWWAGARSSAGQGQVEAVRKFQWALLRDFPALVLMPGEAVRSQVAG